MNLGIGIQGSNDGREQHLEDDVFVRSRTAWQLCSGRE